jgi:hypothetical protein
MTIFCTKQKLTFVNHGKWIPNEKHPDMGTYENAATINSHTVTVDPKPEFQEVPDWVENTPTYRAALKAGLVFKVKVEDKQIAQEFITDVPEALGEGEEAPPPSTGELLPPTLARVLKAGYSQEAAEKIVAEERRKFIMLEKPYGPNERTAPSDDSAAKAEAERKVAEEAEAARLKAADEAAKAEEDAKQAALVGAGAGLADSSGKKGKGK